jgi:hypothetical protein
MSADRWGAVIAELSLPVSTDRDSWATPPWLTELLPEVDLDPCSNNRSTVKARPS